MANLFELRRKLIAKARKGIEEKFTGRDQHIIRAVALIDDLDAIANLLFERLREWYGMHFPELEKEIVNPEKFLRLVYELSERKNFTEEKLKEFVEDETQRKRLADKAAKSMGSPVEEQDLKEIKLLALNALNLKEEKNFLSKYVEELSAKEMPNASRIAGSTIAARMLAKAGSLKKLAFMPSSTIQVIGAEKALFEHLKKGVRGPKYGYLYSHPLVRAAKRESKGRTARAIAGKIVIAVRQDFFGKKTDSGKLVEDLNERVKQIEALPPKKKAGERGK